MWLIYVINHPHYSWAFRLHWDNRKIDPVPVQQPWIIWKYWLESVHKSNQSNHKYKTQRATTTICLGTYCINSPFHISFSIHVFEKRYQIFCFKYAQADYTLAQVPSCVYWLFDMTLKGFLIWAYIFEQQAYKQNDFLWVGWGTYIYIYIYMGTIYTRFIISGCFDGNGFNGKFKLLDIVTDLEIK